MEDDISLVDAYSLVPNGVMKYVSPGSFETMFTKLVEKNLTPDIPCEDEGFDANLECLKIHVLAHISYWFEVVSDHSEEKYLHVHSFSLDMIKRYVHVLYLIASFEGTTLVCSGGKSCLDCHEYIDSCGNDVRELSEGEYLDIYFPGASTSVSGNIFMHSYGHWHIRFNGWFKFAKDTKGMHVLELLLSDPGRSMPYPFINDVLNPVTSEFERVKYIGDCEFKEELSVDMSESGDVHNAHAGSRRNNIERWSKDKELLALGKEYESCTDKSRKREIGDEIKRMQAIRERLEDVSQEELIYKKIYDGIAKNLRDTLRYIQNIFPELHSHLQESLRSSNCYAPKEKTCWHTRHNKNEFNRSMSGHAVNFIIDD